MGTLVPERERYTMGAFVPEEGRYCRGAIVRLLKREDAVRVLLHDS